MRLDRWIALALFALAVLYFSLTSTATFDLRDEGYLLLRSAQAAAGAMPHRDFADVYGPGVFALSGLALALGGGEILAVRVLVLLFKALAVVASYGLARRVSPRWLAVGAAVVGIAWWGRLAANLNAPYAALFTIPIALAATLFLVRGFERDSVRDFALAGLLAGLAILFKQSLGAMLGFGLLLSAIAVPWLSGSDSGNRESRSGAAGFAAGWLAASFLPLLPVAGWLTPEGYVVHLLPLRLVLVAVAVAGWVRGTPSPARLARSVLPVAVGGAFVLLLALGVYAAAGGLGALLHDMFELPFSIRGYAQPVDLPAFGLALFFAAVIAGVATGVLALAGRRGASVVSAALALACFAVGAWLLPADAPGLRDPATLLARGPFALEALVLPGLIVAGLLASVRHAGDPAALQARVPVLIVSALLCFEVFPRAGHNLWILHGALTPLLALVLGGCLEASGAGSATPLRRRLAAAMLLVIPFWLVTPLVRTVLFPEAGTGEKRALALPHTSGLRLDAVQRVEQEIPHVEALVAWLATQPPDEPLLLLTNDWMIPFLAGRNTLFEDRSFALFLAGWGMLPPEARRELDDPQRLERLAEMPAPIVIHRADRGAAQLRGALPRVREAVERDFRVVERFGPYRVLRRASSVGE